MKKFNEVIKIEVPVNAIANSLLAKFEKEFPHAELLTEAIIATGLDKGNLSHIYNALSGVSVEIDFQVGQEVAVKSGEITYYNNNERVRVTEGVVVEVNKWTTKNVRVEYSRSNGEVSSEWVGHTSLSNVIEPIAEAINISPSVN